VSITDTYYRTRVTAVGEEVEMMLDEGVLIFFGDPAPEELAEVSVLHRPEAAPSRPITPGDTVHVGGDTATVTAVGSLADHNLTDLGHLVLYADPGPDTKLLPGAVHVTGHVGVPGPDTEILLSAPLASPVTAIDNPHSRTDQEVNPS
jgi:PTS system glucitol/sorbitol-specific IIA component